MIEIGRGILTGVVMALLIGPVFFALLQTSIEKGIRSGTLMAIGISMSDSLYMSLTYFGISQFSESAKFKIFLAMAGSLLMLAFGLRMISRPVYHQSSKIHLEESVNKLRNIAKGFFLNGLNPFVLFFWIGVVSLVTVHWDYSQGEAFVFYVSLLSTILLTDIGKVYLANRIRASITSRLMKIINRVVGIAFILLGLRLLFFALHLVEELYNSGQSLLNILF